MKPILLTGTAAYSPFRLDALRAALGSYAPELKTAQIDARWVYAIQPEGDGPDEETLARAALLLNVVPSAECLVPSAELTHKDGCASNARSTKHEAPSTFYVTPRKRASRASSAVSALRCLPPCRQLPLARFTTE